MAVLKNIGCLATCSGVGDVYDIGLIKSAAIAWRKDEVQWVGPEKDLPSEFRDDPQHDAGGRLVVPGLIDCHTHLAFGGWRADEFEQRCRGASYLDIAAKGGGIMKTVRQTREATEDILFDRVQGFARQIARLGVTMVECKSGYGLNLADELKLLRVYRRLADSSIVRVVSTFLGAHVVPGEFTKRRGDYVDTVCEKMIPQVAESGLAAFCDVFVEESAFSVEEARRILEAGLSHGLRPKLHADQLSGLGGAELAADVGAISADHLEKVSDRGIEALADTGVVAVTLPIASLYLKQPPLDARKLIEAGVRVAVATDFNPGSAPSFHLPLSMTLACTMNGLSPGESLLGATRHAAAAIGLEDEIGSIERGKKADFAVVDATEPNDWLYHFRPNAVVDTFLGGSRVPRARD